MQNEAERCFSAPSMGAQAPHDAKRKRPNPSAWEGQEGYVNFCNEALV